MILYRPTVYLNTKDNSSRFVLGTNGVNTLCVIGVNPSTADESEPDFTLKKVMSFVHQNGYDSFIMLNVYPERAKNPTNLSSKWDPNLVYQNIQHIKSIVENLKNPHLLAAWGETICERDYLMCCLTEIEKSLQGLKIKWMKLGDYTATKHPRHPSRAPYNTPLTPFDLKAYLEIHQ
ncbi:DUF1643 domain-containing protein [Flagellimonas sp.]|uniref:DUF1643 domain-containing protein n=1 Tax=Flagellimonas sp. TaxID=2058762 RepID=UPI003AB85C79